MSCLEQQYMNRYGVNPPKKGDIFRYEDGTIWVFIGFCEYEGKLEGMDFADEMGDRCNFDDFVIVKKEMVQINN